MGAYEALPALRALQSGSNITLAWPLWATNFVLQETFTESPAFVWTNVLAEPNSSGENQIIELPMTAPTKFYRLRLP